MLILKQRLERAIDRAVALAAQARGLAEQARMVGADARLVRRQTKQARAISGALRRLRNPA